MLGILIGRSESFFFGRGSLHLRGSRVKGRYVADKQFPPELASSTCPECGTEMVIVRIKPILFGGSLEELSLACTSCGLTKKIKIKRN
jgi:RNase P subunit RPR2